jgi:hypothetical protein
MSFEQLAAKAAEEANENELVTLREVDLYAYLNGDRLSDKLDTILDHVHDDMAAGKKPVVGLNQNCSNED